MNIFTQYGQPISDDVPVWTVPGHNIWKRSRWDNSNNGQDVDFNVTSQEVISTLTPYVPVIMTIGHTSWMPALVQLQRSNHSMYRQTDIAANFFFRGQNEISSYLISYPYRRGMLDYMFMGCFGANHDFQPLVVGVIKREDFDTGEGYPILSIENCHKIEVWVDKRMNEPIKTGVRSGLIRLMKPFRYKIVKELISSGIKIVVKSSAEMQTLMFRDYPIPVPDGKELLATC